MNAIFAPDSALMRVLTRIADLAILNILFIVTSLPIVTLGASLTALNSVALRIAAGSDRTITGDYFRSFRRNFRQATLLFGILVLLVAVLAGWWIVVTVLVTEPVLRFILLAVWFVLTFMFTMAALYVFPYLATFEGTIREVLRTARLMSLRHPLPPLTVIALTALLAVVSIFSPQATGYGLLWLAIGFAGIAFLGAVVFIRVFNRYAPELVVPAAEDEEE
ncbi:putative membrane protein YesL [Microbacterium terrae]|uniref:Membrane protein YesL n=1 Tax=Microbacterium terrae TaxID=69369 RepID=A0A0M2GY56_9MICO|nr:DUF624 domain-containing protein [Microbacterium terrae]KJL38695.1 hypothetical protein RS81_02490 [Microbacterium terrae]MBP1076114.1 putative membrane protein YesL [Microbacterium terrae]GLJ96934.1 beta-carotene 15,15'-monooxygenase [Microbacterium terrae]